MSSFDYVRPNQKLEKEHAIIGIVPEIQTILFNYFCSHLFVFFFDYSVHNSESGRLCSHLESLKSSPNGVKRPPRYSKFPFTSLKFKRIQEKIGLFLFVFYLIEFYEVILVFFRLIDIVWFHLH